MKLTILFDSPYWIGLLEDERDGCLYAVRFIFGAEPNDETVYKFVLREFVPLMRSMTVGVQISDHPQSLTRVNPKRQQREIRRELKEAGVSSKAQEAIKHQMTQNKAMRRTAAREDREAEKEHRREIARQKAKAKHRGR